MSTKRKNIFQLFYSSFVTIILLLVSQVSYAIVIGPNTIISSSTTYANETIDMTNGNFIVNNNATLTLEDCTIVGTLSVTNPTLISVPLGSLVMNSNTFNVTVAGLAANPNTQSLYYVIRLGQANANLTGNAFSVNSVFTGGLLITDVNTPTGVINIANNSFQGFHGVLYLLNSPNSIIDNNIFNVNSYGNLLLTGNNSTITNNKFYFAGRDQTGNAMDIVDSEGITISDNVVFTPTCLGIHILASQNIVINSNSLTGGVTYAITLESTAMLKDKSKGIDKNYAVKLLSKLGKKRMKHAGTSGITISNNVISQNRYGIEATDVDNLTVTGNYFSQKFSDDASRKFWTDNNNLFQNVTNLNWSNNLYKEAFSQDINGDNSNIQFVTFPASGGVVL